MIRAVRARIPPSPSLSARITNAMYLIEITIISDQKINETIPSTFAIDTSSP
jgi:hypothetical protein